jgi:hypothetical protein
MLDAGTLFHSGPIGHDADDGTVRVDFMDDPSAVASALVAAGARVETDGLRLSVRTDDGDPFDLIRDVIAQHGGSIHKLSGAAASLEDLFIRHGEQR